MSEHGEFSVSELRSKRAQSHAEVPIVEPASHPHEFSFARPPTPRSQPIETDDSDDEGGFKLPVDRWRIVAALKRRWYWILLAACLAAPLGFLAGTYKVAYKIKLTFIMREASPAFAAGLVGESYRPQQLTLQTLVNLIRSPELFRFIREVSPFEASG